VSSQCARLKSGASATHVVAGGVGAVVAVLRAYGGWVALESEPGAGATFTCHLPEETQTVSQPRLSFG
jgi:chemotaxis protein histidine kinase CheA